jgi:hypothetical protein
MTRVPGRCPVEGVEGKSRQDRQRPKRSLPTYPGTESKRQPATATPPSGGPMAERRQRQRHGEAAAAGTAAAPSLPVFPAAPHRTATGPHDVADRTGRTGRTALASPLPPTLTATGHRMAVQTHTGQRKAAGTPRAARQRQRGTAAATSTGATSSARAGRTTERNGATVRRTGTERSGPVLMDG